jgi:hypothetical protein
MNKSRSRRWVRKLTREKLLKSKFTYVQINAKNTVLMPLKNIGHTYTGTRIKTVKKNLMRPTRAVPVIGENAKGKQT